MRLTALQTHSKPVRRVQPAIAAVTQDIITIWLPLPDKRLNPNSREGWYKALSPKAKSRDDYTLITKTVTHNFTRQCRLKATICVSKATKARFDIDNIAASCKAYLDGIFAGLNLDDGQIDELLVVRGPVNTACPGSMLTIEKITV